MAEDKFITPADIARWEATTSNGRIPLAKLEVIQPEMYDPDLGGSARLWTPAARAMSAMIYAAREDGLNFRVLYSYRTYAKQVEKWNDYMNGGNVAARPGYSNHGDARSVDLTDLGYDDLNWLKREGGRYGYRADVAGESWHHTYMGGRLFDAGWEEDVNLEKYDDGIQLYIERYKKNLDKHPFDNPDPGEPPPERDAWFKRGWTRARAMMQSPKAK